MRISLFFISMLLLSCSDKISESQFPYLNGYWEIEEVVFPDGERRQYTVNTTIDFIELADSTGFRKKVSPRLDGSYITSDDAEVFSVVISPSGAVMKYSNALSTWEERLTELSENRFSVVNEENITYHYKRFHPINASDGQTKKK